MARSRRHHNQTLEKYTTYPRESDEVCEFMYDAEPSCWMLYALVMNSNACDPKPNRVSALKFDVTVL